MAWAIEFSPVAQKELKKLDSQTAMRILNSFTNASRHWRTRA
jgi:mRNA-degrading endonuclease RelE of RelBE toxin-antitoxin system